MVKVQDYVITDITIDKQKSIDDLLYTLIHTGIIKQTQVHIRTREV